MKITRKNIALNLLKGFGIFVLLFLGFAGLAYCILYFMGLMPGLTTGELYDPRNYK